MTYLLIAIHVLASIFLILVVLLQQGKGADLAGAFGGGGTQTVFGARGATTMLHKLTTALFVVFILTSIALAVIQSRPSGSVMAGTKAAPAAPATTTTGTNPATATTAAPVTAPSSPISVTTSTQVGTSPIAVSTSTQVGGSSPITVTTSTQAGTAPSTPAPAPQQ